MDSTTLLRATVSVTVLGAMPNAVTTPTNGSTKTNTQRRQCAVLSRRRRFCATIAERASRMIYRAFSGSAKHNIPAFRVNLPSALQGGSASLFSTFGTIILMQDLELQLQTIRRGCDELLIEADLLEKLKS